MRHRLRAEEMGEPTRRHAAVLFEQVHDDLQARSAAGGQGQRVHVRGGGVGRIMSPFRQNLEREEIVEILSHP